ARMSFFFLIPPPPRSTLFPYTTLFRSKRGSVSAQAHREVVLPVRRLEGTRIRNCTSYIRADATGLGGLQPGGILRRGGPSLGPGSIRRRDVWDHASMEKEGRPSTHLVTVSSEAFKRADPILRIGDGPTNGQRPLT